MNIKLALILAVCFTSFSTSFMSSSINVAVAAISGDYGIKPDYITYAISAYVISATAFLIPSSALANYIGYHKAFSLGAISTAVCALLVAFAPDFYLFVGLRALQGACNALLFSTGTALISDNIDKEHRGSAIGINVAAVYAGLTFSPVLGGILTDSLGWQSMFFITAALNVISYSIGRKVPYDTPNSSNYPHLKMLFCVSGFICVLIALSQMAQSYLYSALLLLGVVLLVVYLGMEKKSDNPLINFSMLIKNRILGWALGASFFNYMATFAVALLLSMHLQLVMGYSAMHTGLILLIQPALQCLFSPYAGKLSQTVSSHLIVLAGMSLSTVSMVIFIFLNKEMALSTIILGQSMCGIGFGLFSAPNTTIVMNSVDRSKFALVSALQAVTRNAGMSLCMAMLTFIFAVYIVAAKGSDLYLTELSVSISYSFILSVGLGIAGLICCLLGYKAAQAAGDR